MTTLFRVAFGTTSPLFAPTLTTVPTPDESAARAYRENLIRLPGIPTATLQSSEDEGATWKDTDDADL
jgi:hypothetical protein